MDYEDERNIWVEFVGGPLDGQCRSISHYQTELMCGIRSTTGFERFEGASSIVDDMAAGFVTYKIERFRVGKPGTLGYREGWKGVLK